MTIELHNEQEIASAKIAAEKLFFGDNKTQEKVMPKNDRYFVDPLRPEKGLTSSSASFLAGLAAQEAQRLESTVDGAVFFDTTTELLAGDRSPRLTSKGKDEAYLTSLSATLNRIGELNGFIAYVHEAVREKEMRTAFLDSFSFDDWLNRSENSALRDKRKDHLKLKEPEKPVKKPDVGLDWAKSQLNLKELTRYLLLEAKASALGRRIHPDGVLADAKNVLSEKLVRPVKAYSVGRETTIEHYEPSVEPEKVFAQYNRWQSQHRAWEAELNTLKNKMQIMMKNENLQRNRDYRQKLADYDTAATAYQMAFSKNISEEKQWESLYADWLISEHDAVRNLKIVVPHELQPVYDYLSSLSNEI